MQMPINQQSNESKQMAGDFAQPNGKAKRDNSGVSHAQVSHLDNKENSDSHNQNGQVLQRAQPGADSVKVREIEEGQLGDEPMHTESDRDQSPSLVHLLGRSAVDWASATRNARWSMVHA